VNLVPIFALSKLGVLAKLALFFLILLTNAARALGSGYSQTSRASGFFAKQKIRFIRCESDGSASLSQRHNRHQLLSQITLVPPEGGTTNSFSPLATRVGDF